MPYRANMVAVSNNYYRAAEALRRAATSLFIAGQTEVSLETLALMQAVEALDRRVCPQPPMMAHLQTDRMRRVMRTSEEE